MITIIVWIITSLKRVWLLHHTTIRH